MVLAGIILLILGSGSLGSLGSDHCTDQFPGTVSTLRFHTEIHSLPPDFWSQGVDNSKVILEAILGKIKMYEKGQDRKWTDVIQGIGSSYVDVRGGEIWMDDKNSMSVKVDTTALCGLTKPLGLEIEYDCRESEQLYGIAYHKVYEVCKQDPLLGNYNVDWGVCLHSHYPWVDILTTNICVMKSYKNDFIACFCTTNDSRLDSRGFCITKFECLLNNAGVEKAQQTPLEVPSSDSALPPSLILELIHLAGQVSQECAGHVQYFLEANTKDTVWFETAQRKDNLRVRAPYHPDSPCKNVMFRGLFDIGQLDVDNIEAGIEVFTPYIEDVYSDPSADWEPPIQEMNEEMEQEGSCKPPEMDPVHKVKMENLSFFFEERILADMIIWIPGILFLYSSMTEERSWAQQLLVSIVQGLVIAIGLYNIIISVLPLHMYSNIDEVRQIQGATFVILVFFANIFLNHKEVTELFLKIAMFCFIFDIVIWKLIVVMYTEERMANFQITYITFLLFITLYSAYSLFKIFVQIFQNKNLSNNKVNETQVRGVKKRKNKPVKAAKQEPVEPSPAKQESLEPAFAKQDSRRGKLPVGDKSDVASYLCPKKSGRETGSLTSTFLDRSSNKGKVKTKKGSVTVVRSNSETSNSSREDKDHSRLDTKLKPKYVMENNSNNNIISNNNNNRNINWSNSNSSSSSHYVDPWSSARNALPKVGQSASDALRWRPQVHNPVPHFASQMSVSTTATDRQDRPRNLAVTAVTDRAGNKDSLHHSSLVEQLVVHYCPESVDPACKLPQKSKILSIIRENCQTEEFPHRATVGEIGETTDMEEGGSGFLIDISKDEEKMDRISDCLVFVPGTERNGAKREETSSTVCYKTGNLVTAVSFQEMEVTVEREEVEIKENKDEAVLTSPLARILAKQLSGYSASAVDKAINEVLLHTNIETLTIPKFRDILVARLEKQAGSWGQAVYVSDEEEEEEREECHICLNPLEGGLEVLSPCQHVFHQCCISSWVERKEAEASPASCPKCRAVI